jgi:hypothetical protein
MHAQQGREKAVSQGGGGSKPLKVGGNTLGQPKNMSPSDRYVSSEDVHMSLLISDSVKRVAGATMNKGGAPSDAPIIDKSNGTTMAL